MPAGQGQLRGSQVRVFLVSSWNQPNAARLMLIPFNLPTVALTVSDMCTPCLMCCFFSLPIQRHFWPISAQTKIKGMQIYTHSSYCPTITQSLPASGNTLDYLSVLTHKWVDRLHWPHNVVRNGKSQWYIHRDAPIYQTRTCSPHFTQGDTLLHTNAERSKSVSNFLPPLSPNTNIVTTK